MIISLKTRPSKDLPKFLNPEVDGYILAALFSLISFVYGMTMSPNFHLQMVQGRGYSDNQKLLKKPVISYDS